MNEQIEKYLQLEDDLRRYRKALNEALDIMLDQDVTNYPIFIFHQQELEMGVPIIEAGESTGLWSVHASSLEEFVMKNIIETEKVDEFRRVFREHDHHLCLFVLSELGAQFIYIPREEHLNKSYGNLN
jgi:hypothetical protein